ncbi:S14 cytosolic factor [Saitozyma podzolica]|uniref:S14 cytosolic factor n=1 Tax=Saitozyma podzolica TaxID=1890683 RepID=A0A427XPH7_9TREE|nr:S14 cytosolic factor [Saitozyma podzolica]
MGHMFIINAPYLFSTVWSLIKPWLDEATVRKIHILGKNYKQELQQYIAPENLPKDLGGTCSCAGGCSLSDAGPWNKVAQA